MKEDINLAFYAWVVVQYIAVKVAKLRGIPFQNRTLEQCCNIRFYQNSALKGDKTLEMLHKEHDVLIVYILIYQNYFAFIISFIKVGVEVAQVGLISPFYQRFGSECSFNNRWKDSR